MARAFLKEKRGGRSVNQIVWLNGFFLNHVFVVAQIVQVGRLHMSFLACSTTTVLAAHRS